MFDQLESESPEVRAAAGAAILQPRLADNERVAAIVRKYISVESRAGTVKDNMLLLGKLRAVEQVPLLVENLTFEAFYKITKRPQTVEDLHPAVPALIDIGSPAIRPVIDRLEREDGEKLQITGAAVLRGILGNEWATALLQHEMKSSDDTRSARLRRVIRLISELP